MIIQSAGMTADGFHSLADGASNVVGLIGVRLAARPVDDDHPYGHNKFETLFALIISAALFAVGAGVVCQAVGRLYNPVVPQITIPSLAALIVTLLINIAVTVIEYRAGKSLGSQILISDSMHTRSDVLVSLGVLFSLAGIRFGLPAIIDPIASLVVAAFIMLAAWEIFKENSDILVDRAVIDEAQVKDVVMRFHEVGDTYKIRSRGSRYHLFIDLHLLVRPDLTIAQSHDLVHHIELAIQESVCPDAQVFAHIEPCRSDGPPDVD
jgi:cation diffusion facilitator family transporter